MLRSASILAVALAAISAHATLINFDDGTNGNAVGGFYAGLGVTFSNAVYTPFGGLPGGSNPLTIASISDYTTPGQGNPIGASFSSVQGSVTLRGIDVGEAGFILKAYNAANVLVDSDTVFGTGLGIGEFFDLTVTGAISRIEFSQVTPGAGGDGVAFDDLSFSPAGTVPGPAAAFSFALMALRRRKRA